MTESHCKYSFRSRPGCVQGTGVRARVSAIVSSGAAFAPWSQTASGRLLVTGMDCNDVDGRVLPVEGDS
jgi:hypothetical protein